VEGRYARAWVAGFIVLLAVFGFGQLESWPFTNWYMFSGVEPAVANVGRVIAVAPDGAESILGTDALPDGLLSHRLLQRFERASGDERARLCGELLDAARAAGPAREVRIERRSWRVLDRAGDRPANVATTVIEVCR
jgi:hypothetical protein